MIEILQNKNSATRFQILVEIAASGPNIHQRSIADKMGITPQAVSDYIHQMLDEEMILSTGRSSYRVSVKGVNWVLKMLRELNEYIPMVSKAVTNLTVCAAIAESNIRKGQSVGLKMKEGMLYATTNPEVGARGIAMSDSCSGEDIDVSQIEGLVDFRRGSVAIFQVPSIVRGGSKNSDLKSLRGRIKSSQQVGAIGIEALVALRRIDIEPQYLYGVAQAAVEAVHCGLPFTIVCTDDAISELIKKLQEDKLEYQITNLSLNSKKSAK